MQIERIVTGVLEENCYLAGCPESGQAAIIDPGDDADKILAALSAGGFHAGQILLTHAHLDHLSAAAALQRATGAPISLHRAEKRNFENFALQSAMFGFPLAEPFEVAVWLQGGETIRVGELSISVLFTPGHTAGGVCFYGHGHLFSGDAIFRNSIGRSDLPGGDADQLMNSIRTVLFALPDETVVHPGHGAATSIAHEKKYNPFLR